MTIYAKLKLRDTRAQKKLAAAVAVESEANHLKCVAWEEAMKHRQELRCYEIRNKLKPSRNENAKLSDSPGSSASPTLKTL